MSHTSVFVITNGVSGPSPGVIADRIAELAECKVKRLDLVITSSVQYYFVHLNGIMAKHFYDLLSAGQRIFYTIHGVIRVGIDRSAGLDPLTKDTIVQFKLTSSGTFWRNFKNPDEVKRWHDTAMTWVPTLENPFIEPEMQDVEMDDTFYSADEGERDLSPPRNSAFSPHAEADEANLVELGNATFAPFKDMTKKKCFLETEEEKAICKELFA